MSRFWGVMALVCIGVFQTAYAQPVFFRGCGILVQGVECVLFDSDSAGLYVVENLGGFSVGDRVRVEGELNDTCVTICMQGDGCIENATVVMCNEVIPTLTEWGMIIFSILLFGWMAWVVVRRRKAVKVSV